MNFGCNLIWNPSRFSEAQCSPEQVELNDLRAKASQLNFLFGPCRLLNQWRAMLVLSLTVMCEGAFTASHCPGEAPSPIAADPGQVPSHKVARLQKPRSNVPSQQWDGQAMDKIRSLWPLVVTSLRPGEHVPTGNDPPHVRNRYL